MYAALDLFSWKRSQIPLHYFQIKCFNPMQLSNSSSEKDTEMRVLLYSFLSAEGSFDSQKVHYLVLSAVLWF